MSEFLEEMIMKDRKESAVRMLERGKLTNDEIAEVLELPLEIVEKLEKVLNAGKLMYKENVRIMSSLVEELLADVRKSTAKRMLADGGISFEKIAKYANIPVKEVERLADELQKAESQN